MKWLARLFALLRRPPEVEAAKRRSDRVIADYKRADVALRVVRRPK